MRKLLVFIVMVVFYSTSHAQFIKSIGIKGGGTTTQQKHEYKTSMGFKNDDPASVIGFNAGLFGEFLETPVFSLIGEINYAEKGFEKTFILQRFIIRGVLVLRGL